MPARVHAEARAPHMTAVAVTSAAVGFVQLVSGHMPSTIADAASPIVGHVWSVLIIIGGITVIAGAWMRPVVLGLRLEAAGHIGLAAGVLVYLAANITWMTSPWWVSPAVWWAAAVAVASIVRWWQIWHVMWSVRHV